MLVSLIFTIGDFILRLQYSKVIQKTFMHERVLSMLRVGLRDKTKYILRRHHL